VKRISIYCLALAALMYIPQAAAFGDADRERSTKPTFTLWQLPEQTTTQMMSYVLRIVGGRVIVVGGGNAGDAPYLNEFLKSLGNNVDAWFITHPHDDHINALIEVLRAPGNLKIRRIYISMPDENWIRGYEPGAADVGPSEVCPFPGRSRCRRRSETPKRQIRKPSPLRLCPDGAPWPERGSRGVYKAISPSYCLWPTPRWLWDNDGGKGKGSGPWLTLEVRTWMDKLNIERHYVTAIDGLSRIN